MNASESFLEYLDDQLSDFQPYTSKKMFGGLGYFKDGKIFGAIMDGKFMLKVDDSNRKDFEDHGMKPWSPPNRNMKMPYYPVPSEILKNKKALNQWCSKAWEISKSK